jgi:hypothetical protein
MPHIEVEYKIGEVQEILDEGKALIVKLRDDGKSPVDVVMLLAAAMLLVKRMSFKDDTGECFGCWVHGLMDGIEDVVEFWPITTVCQGVH